MAAHNFDGSHPSNGVADNTAAPLHAEPEQPLIQAPGEGSMLNNPGTDGGDDRPPNPAPMQAFGHEGDGGALFDLNPS